MGQSEGKEEAPSGSTVNGKASGAGARGDLQMEPEVMLDLAAKAAALMVEWSERLPGEHAWDGEFREEIEKQLMEDPPRRAGRRKGSLNGPRAISSR